jgi:hypothetical protein
MAQQGENSMSISVSNFCWKGLVLAVIAIFLLVASLPALAQSPTTDPEMGIYGTGQQVASLRPGHGLMWQRTSPSVQRLAGLLQRVTQIEQTRPRTARTPR